MKDVEEDEERQDLIANPESKICSGSNDLIKYQKFKRAVRMAAKDLKNKMGLRVFVEQYFPIFKRKMEQKLIPMFRKALQDYGESSDEQKLLDFEY